MRKRIVLGANKCVRRTTHTPNTKWSEIVLHNLSWKRSLDINLTCPQICRDEYGVELGRTA